MQEKQNRSRKVLPQWKYGIAFERPLRLFHQRHLDRKTSIRVDATGSTRRSEEALSNRYANELDEPDVYEERLFLNEINAGELYTLIRENTRETYSPPVS